jgi:hypothetical protein
MERDQAMAKARGKRQRREALRRTKGAAGNEQADGLASQVKDAALAAAGKVGDLVNSAARAVKEAVTSKPARR